MGVDRKNPSLAGMLAGVVVGERLIPVRNEQSILIWEMFHPVGLHVEEAEAVGAGLEAGVVGAVLPVLGDVGVEVERRLETVVGGETVQGPPGCAALRAVGKGSECEGIGQQASTLD